jgi:hypothetical protein
MSLDDLRKRLRQMGVTTGQEFVPKARSVDGARIEDLLDGTVRESDLGSFYEVAHAFPVEMGRGPHTLQDWISQDRGLLASIGDLDAARLPDLDRFIFLDTETTGLGGAGALPFLVGVGAFDHAEGFSVRQFFLRDPSEEDAMLAYLLELVRPDSALVTFNGRVFDVPLLRGRYTLARRATHIDALPNLDLLLPARRMWRRRLPSCALGSLEADILGIRRSQADVPGALIPYLYQQYLRSGDARQMARVFYHNEQDILSMVTLAVILTRAFGQPAARDLHIDDRISLARWYESRGMMAECEAAYRMAMDEAPDAETRRDALAGYAALLKRLGRRSEGVPLWEFLADLKLDIQGHEELAKYDEWHAGDLAGALRWAEAGIALAGSWTPGLRRTEALSSLNHRRERLIRKLAGKVAAADLDQEET